MKAFVRALILLALVSAGVLLAQVPLPIGALPPPLGQGADRIVSSSTAMRARVSGAVRLEGIRTLLIRHPEVLERDHAGALVVRSEILALVEPAIPHRVREAGFKVLRQRELGRLRLKVTVLRPPVHLSTRQALQWLRELDPAGSYDFNHVYTGSGETVSVDGTARIPVSGAPMASGLQRPVRVGLIDAGIDATHPAFDGTDTRLYGCDGRRVPSAHGTAVASLLVGTGTTELHAADVYCGTPTGGAVDALVDALAWMSEQQVAVINLSLVGPANRLLERVTAAMLEQGHLLVAAVGNDGPAAPPLYPAAYPGVIGVTGVDPRRRVLPEAGRGPQVDFAARGADVAAATPAAGYGAVRGTSFAAPIVAALLANGLITPDRTAAAAVVAGLSARAIDLGPRGRDRTYGDGLVGEPGKTGNK